MRLRLRNPLGKGEEGPPHASHAISLRGVTMGRHLGALLALDVDDPLGSAPAVDWDALPPERIADLLDEILEAAPECRTATEQRDLAGEAWGAWLGAVRRAMGTAGAFVDALEIHLSHGVESDGGPPPTFSVVAASAGPEAWSAVRDLPMREGWFVLCGFGVVADLRAQVRRSARMN